MTTSSNKVRRLDNHRVFRPEAVEAYATRRAGEAWETRLPPERYLLVILSLLAVLSGVCLFFGMR